MLVKILVGCSWQKAVTIIYIYIYIYIYVYIYIYIYIICIYIYIMYMHNILYSNICRIRVWGIGKRISLIGICTLF